MGPLCRRNYWSVHSNDKEVDLDYQQHKIWTDHLILTMLVYSSGCQYRMTCRAIAWHCALSETESQLTMGAGTVRNIIMDEWKKECRIQTVLLVMTTI
jgi:hypothetical protein